MYHCNLNTAYGCAVFRIKSKVLWGCADRTLNLNACVVVDFACFRGWNYLSPVKRSFVKPASGKLFTNFPQMCLEA